MNNIFMGSCTRDGEIYDYSGIWTRGVPGVEWKAIVRSAGVVCRPKGKIAHDAADEEVLLLITEAIEGDIEQTRALPPAARKFVR